VADQWNHNVHYHRLIFEAIPPGCERALDVGCGTGRLTRELGRVVPHVLGVDRDEQSIAVARAESGSGDIEYRHGDFLELPLKPESFDLVTAVASLHHMDTATAINRMRDLLRPAGVLVVIGLAREGLSPGLALIVPGLVDHRIQLLRHRPAPRGANSDCAAKVSHQPPIVWPPPETYRQIRRMAGSLLPGMRYRRHLLWRYSIRWTKPG
jgi:ubiquinone/menaquinone biosynthesis C-methylase UbiE